MMKYLLFVLPFLAGEAFAQEDVYKKLALGDRVQVTFRSGATVIGNLVPPPSRGPIKPTVQKAASGGTTPASVKIAPPAPVPAVSIDYSKEASLTLDLSWEYPGLNGTMTLLKDQIKAIQKLEKLDAAMRHRVEEEREKIRKQVEADDAERKAAEEARDQAAVDAAKKAEAEEKATAAASSEGEKVVQAAEELSKGLELLAKFPPPEWGPEKLKEFQGKSVRRQILTPDEREFLEGFEQWLKAKTWKENQKSESSTEEKKTEEKKP